MAKSAGKPSEESKTKKIVREYSTKSGNIYSQELITDLSGKLISENWYRSNSSSKVQAKGLIKNAVYLSGERYLQLESQKGDMMGLIKAAKKENYSGNRGIIWFCSLDGKYAHSSYVENISEKEKGLIKTIQETALKPNSSDISDVLDQTEDINLEELDAELEKKGIKDMEIPEEISFVDNEDDLKIVD